VTLAVLALTLALGLASRRYRDVLPRALGDYAGDTLWAAALFFALRVVRPAPPGRVIAGVALAIAFAVELSQLAHPQWLDGLRHRPGVGLILGYGFVPSDLACYAAGVALAWTIDTATRRTVDR
jgi:hypothetical protein